MRKIDRNLAIAISVLALSLFCVRANAAAQQGTQGKAVHATKQEAAHDLNNYQVKYKVDELENGKTVNSRSYTVMLEVGGLATVRIGSRVPYLLEKDTPQYQNVGMNIGCDIRKQEGSLTIHTKLDMTAFAGYRPASGLGSFPVMGMFQFENSAVVNLGKPQFVGSADDVASNRHYVIEVTVTKAD